MLAALLRYLHGQRGTSSGAWLALTTTTIQHRCSLITVSRPAALTLLSMMTLTSLPCLALDQSPTDSQRADLSDRFAVHGQFTYVEQETNDFHAPYSGANSLSPNNGRETSDATLQLGARLWSGAEIWLNPEIDEGFGLNNTLGVAAFPSGTAYKVGYNRPNFRLNRAFVRDTFNVGEVTESVEGTANQFATRISSNRWVVTVGKVSVPDIFDSNQYAHDPRADYLNWTSIDSGVFDYAADAWGYTIGAAVEWYHGAWALRLGLFDLSDVPNSQKLTPGGHQFQMIGEAERRYDFNGHPGRTLVTVYDSRARMASLKAAVALGEATQTPPDVALVRTYQSRTGISASLEQELTADLGAFARIGGASGNVEVYEFTDVDRSYSMGLALTGRRWGRAQDTFALSLLDDRISADRIAYLNAGGLGVLVGDGKLPHPGPEDVVETYYKCARRAWLQVTLDYQWVNHPAYNRDRGPVSVGTLRIHAQF